MRCNEVVGVLDVFIDHRYFAFLFEMRQHIELFIGAQNEVYAGYAADFFWLELCIAAQNDHHRLRRYFFGALHELLAFFVGVLCN